MRFLEVFSLLLVAGLTFADPCSDIAGMAFVPPADARACLKSFPFNETLRQNLLATSAGVLDFFTFEEYYLESPAPFQESTANIRSELARINSTTYETDYDLSWDLYTFTTQLNDGHTRWFPDCYTSFQSLMPAPIITASVNGTEGVYIAPDLVEFVALIGTAFTSFYDSIGFNYSRLAGARVLSIEGQDPYDFVDVIASTISGNYLDHGVRVNSVFTSYRISGTDFSQRIGDLAGPTGVERDTITMTINVARSNTTETITVPLLANFAGAAFTDGPSYWANNCAATESTNGVDFKGEALKTQTATPRRMMAKGDIRDLGNSNAVGLPDKFHPTLPPVDGSSGVIKSFILPGSETGVMFVGSFSGDFDGFMSDTVAAITSFQKAGVSRLIIDLTNNGGGFICLGFFLFQYLGGAANFPYSGFVSTARGNPLAQKIVASDIALGLDADFSFYTPDNYAFLNGTQMPTDFNYMDPTVSFTVNGVLDPTSQRFHDTCELFFSQPVPDEPPFALENIAIVSNGNCASTCAMFSTLMNERLGTKIAVFGGKPGENVEFKGMAGNQVLEWFDLDSEIKTADLENDPLAPPDLLISGDFRVNWRTAWSWEDEDTPIAYRSELPKLRFPYTFDTYNNPQNLWLFAEQEMF
ncbi:hypothetical protein BDZ89DRAFT_505666 [Hymenopellis radicata]|nr:hypothetical protein BDZ89DRAFT_505666 [Hymenopellis radicata]